MERVHPSRYRMSVNAAIFGPKLGLESLFKKKLSEIYDLIFFKIKVFHAKAATMSYIYNILQCFSQNVAQPFSIRNVGNWKKKL